MDVTLELVLRRAERVPTYTGQCENRPEDSDKIGSCGVGAGGGAAGGAGGGAGAAAAGAGTSESTHTRRRVGSCGVDRPSDVARSRYIITTATLCARPPAMNA